jgi:hypothetical protein
LFEKVWDRSPLELGAKPLKIWVDGHLVFVHTLVKHRIVNETEETIWPSPPPQHPPLTPSAKYSPRSFFDQCSDPISFTEPPIDIGFGREEFFASHFGTKGRATLPQRIVIHNISKIFTDTLKDDFPDSNKTWSIVIEKGVTTYIGKKVGCSGSKDEHDLEIDLQGGFIMPVSDS